MEVSGSLKDHHKNYIILKLTRISLKGFLDLKISMWKRNLITRSVAIVPSLVVALVWGTSGADNLIVWSQILLSIQLPFALIPLLKMTNSERIMGLEFSNPIYMKILGWSIGFLIIIANVILVGFSVMDYLDFDTWLGWLLLAIEIDIGVIYVICLAYISYYAVDKNSQPPIFEIDAHAEEMSEFLSTDDFQLEDDNEEDFNIDDI